MALGRSQSDRGSVTENGIGMVTGLVVLVGDAQARPRVSTVRKEKLVPRGMAQWLCVYLSGTRCWVPSSGVGDQKEREKWGGCTVKKMNITVDTRHSNYPALVAH